MSEAAKSITEPSIPRRQIRWPRAPLAYAQERMWVLYQLDPLSPAFNISLAVRLEGKLDVAALKRALATVARRHEVLRTTFDVTADGQPFQSVHPYPSYWPLSLTDLRSLPDPARDAEVRRLLTAEAARPFNLQTGPTFRTALICLEMDHQVLLLSLHHIIADDGSMDILVRDISVLYGAFVAGTPVPLANLPVQYPDFAVWQRQWLQGDVLQKQIDYWRRQFADLPPVLNLPTDFPRRPGQTFCNEREIVSLNKELSGQVKELARREGANLFTTLLAAFRLLLHQYSGQEDILIGTSIANRNCSSTENLIGFFGNNIVLRINLSGNLTFRELLARARNVTFDAYAHRDVPFETLLDTIRPESRNDRAPLFQVMLVFQSAPLPTLEVDGLKFSLLDSRSETSNFDLVLYMHETGQQLSGHLHYNTDLFAANTIRRLRDRFQNLLHAVATDPGARIDALC
ncbi:MAG TPA: condensation domain-containing protein, partial [Pyrinomonadaceae bacterium]|nr:condensation domain-containing protein [Pyrinomonadaceae bacterium]